MGEIARGIGRAEMTFIVCQVIVILFYGLFVEFGKGTSVHSTEDEDTTTADELHTRYPLW